MWLPKYVLMTVQTEKSLRNVINQSRNACAHYNGDIAGGISKKQFPAITIWLRAKNMAKWGIPEKSIKNVVQRR